MSTVQLSDIAVEFEPISHVKRLGIIALASDLTTEPDAARIIPSDRAAIYVTRIAYENPTTPENLMKMAPRIQGSAALLAPVPELSAVWYSCTSATVTIGPEAVAGPIREALPGVPLVTPAGAAVDAFKALGVQRIALLTPYTVETTQPVADYFTRCNLQVVNTRCLGIEDDRDMARVTAGTIVAAAEDVDRTDAEAIFLSCTALPALGVIAEIEARLNKPVVSSNQASLWRMLHHAGVSARPNAPGRLFNVSPLRNAA